MLREIDDVGAGIRELRRALRLARSTADSDREADVLGSLGMAFVYAGRTADGLAAFDRAIQLSGGVLLGRVLHRRGHVLWTLGRYAAALEDFRQAVAVLQRAGDQTWAARALNGRGLVYLASVRRRARTPTSWLPRGCWQLPARNWRWATPYSTGRAAASALGICRLRCVLLDEAAAGYRALGMPTQALSLARCGVFLAAGLAREALTEADAAIEDLDRLRGRSASNGQRCSRWRRAARWQRRSR